MPDTHAAMTLAAEPAGFVFGRFVLRRRERLLLADGAPVELGSRTVEVLLALVEAAGALLTKGAILDRVWPGIAVAENNLQVQVSALRRALGPDRDWIATIPGPGYRFTGPVAALVDGEAAPVARLPEEAEPPPLSVMVLPFAGRGDDPAQDWFADAITDSLTTDLARAPPGSTVIAQTTADTYKDHPMNARAIGREQGVRYVLEGSVLLADDQVRVNAQLIEAETGAHLWADRFDTPRRDVLQVQDAIVARLARSAGLEMIDAEARRAEQTEHEQPDEGTAEDCRPVGQLSLLGPRRPRAVRPMADAPGLPRTTNRATGVRTLFDRIDAALVSFAAKFWSELLVAFTLAGQCAEFGARSFPPDLPHADENASRRSDTEQAGFARHQDED